MVYPVFQFVKKKMINFVIKLLATHETGGTAPMPEIVDAF
jgi:hypothetical protein